MATRRDNPARKIVSAPTVNVHVSQDDIAAARTRWRAHAQRKYWGLVDARQQLQPTVN